MTPHQVTKMTRNAVLKTRWPTARVKVSLPAQHGHAYAPNLNYPGHLTIVLLFRLASGLERKEESTTDVDFSYKDVS